MQNYFHTSSWLYLAECIQNVNLILPKYLVCRRDIAKSAEPSVPCCVLATAGARWRGSVQLTIVALPRSSFHHRPWSAMIGYRV